MAARARGQVPAGAALLEHRRLHVDVRPLPQRDAEPELAQAGGHARHVREALGVELEVADVLLAEPAGVDVQDVARDAVLAQLPRDGLHLVLRAVGDARHPQPERPLRRDRRSAGEGVVALQHLGDPRSGDDEQVEGVGVLDGQRQRRVLEVADVHADGVRGVDVDAGAAGGRPERHLLVRRGGGVAERLLHPEPLEGAVLHQRAEGLAEAVDPLVVAQVERREGGRAPLRPHAAERVGVAVQEQPALLVGAPPGVAGPQQPLLVDRLGRPQHVPVERRAPTPGTGRAAPRRRPRPWRCAPPARRR